MHSCCYLCLVSLFASIWTGPIVDLNYRQLLAFSFGWRVRLVIFEFVELDFTVVFKSHVFLMLLICHLVLGSLLCLE